VHANATRGRHLRAIRASRGFAYATTLGAAGAFVLGVLAAGLVAGAVAAALVVAGACVAAFGMADRRAERDFWVAVAQALGMRFVGRIELVPHTPLLAAGDRRCCDAWLVGRLPDGRSCGLGTFTFEVESQDSDGDRTWTRYPFTVCLVDVAPPEGAFLRGLYVRPRNALRILGERTLPRVRRERMHTESEAFDRRFDLYRDPDDEPGRVLEVLSPSFVDRLATSSLDLGIDFRAGSLVVFRPGHADDGAGLRMVLELAKDVVRRLDEELAESRAARGADGVRPTPAR
jgi:hypothetical protein